MVIKPIPEKNLVHVYSQNETTQDHTPSYIKRRKKSRLKNHYIT